MKLFSKIIAVFSLASLLFVACNKDTALPTYTTGVSPVLSSSVSSVAATAADSSKTAITFSWSNPKYANSDSTTNKYVLELDSTGRNFSKSVKWTINGSTSKSFTAKALNDVLLAQGFKFNVAYDIDVRVTSSYANNNDLKVSNVVKVNVKPYKINPKITPPTNLYIVGGATDFGWSNSSTINVAEAFAQLDETTFAGVFNLAGGSEYLILPVKGDWSQKYAVPNNGVSGIANGGDFNYYTSGGDNFKSPGTAGMYLITMDFQIGKFTVVPYTGPTLPTDLFMVGNATPGGWNNPVPVPSQQLTRLNSCVWEMPSIAVTGGNEFLMLPVNGSWSNKYSVADKTLPGLSAGGTFGYNLNDNFPAPAVSGNYQIDLNFATAKFKTTKL